MPAREPHRDLPRTACPAPPAWQALNQRGLRDGRSFSVATFADRGRKPIRHKGTARQERRGTTPSPRLSVLAPSHAAAASARTTKMNHKRGLEARTCRDGSAGVTWWEAVRPEPVSAIMPTTPPLAISLRAHASGKTALAVDVRSGSTRGDQFDSARCTASRHRQRSPTPPAALAPHRLLDLATPEVYPPAEFARDGARSHAPLAETQPRPAAGRGTGLYFRALLDGCRDA